jgi:hypothetical protein
MLCVGESQVFNNNMMNLPLRPGILSRLYLRVSSSLDGELATHANLLSWVDH